MTQARAPSWLAVMDASIPERPGTLRNGSVVASVTTAAPSQDTIGACKESTESINRSTVPRGASALTMSPALAGNMPLFAMKSAACAASQASVSTCQPAPCRLMCARGNANTLSPADSTLSLTHSSASSRGPLASRCTSTRSMLTWPAEPNARPSICVCKIALGLPPVTESQKSEDPSTVTSCPNH